MAIALVAPLSRTRSPAALTTAHLGPLPAPFAWASAGTVNAAPSAASAAPTSRLARPCMDPPPLLQSILDAGAGRGNSWARVVVGHPTGDASRPPAVVPPADRGRSGRHHVRGVAPCAVGRGSRPRRSQLVAASAPCGFPTRGTPQQRDPNRGDRSSLRRVALVTRLSPVSTQGRVRAPELHGRGGFIG